MPANKLWMKQEHVYPAKPLVSARQLFRKQAIEMSEDLHDSVPNRVARQIGNGVQV